MPATADALEAHRVALTGHCYRMLGSASEADDAVQETLVRALKGLARFDGRASLRTWLYRIATHVCLDLIADRRRVRPIDEGPPGSPDSALETRPDAHWLEPISDARAIPEDASPEQIAWLRQRTRLAFVAAVQFLPPRQRAALLLAEVLDWSASEIAEVLETSVPAVNSALQRARTTLATRGQQSPPPPPSSEEQTVAERYGAAFARYDVDALVGMLRADAVLSMPPFTLWLRGPADIRDWLEGPGCGCRGSRIQWVQVPGQAAFAQWRADPAGGFAAWALVVLDPAGSQIGAVTSFLDVGRIFPSFGLPLRLA